ncbi:hypothetical protein [Methylophaga sp. UBA2689]|uniref:hypothetical protein n=1 Tax=Methylophaga sp. UBA2689 TaxID=1946878 RepID=UPI0025E65F66|nr:hypothetical protein [Methylophaga sp. UBA2689]|tara:strand:+ start:544 stop:1182 length:639 start_codon:yes stop_codon:yes gene_type:complete
MQPINNEYSIVVLGAWNPSIFSPEWIKKFLVNIEEGEEIEIAFPLDDATAPRKISFKEISIFPGRKKMDLIPIVPSKDNLEFCQSILVTLFNILPHTPVSGFGINFGFLESNLSTELTNLFELSDENSLIDNYVPKGTSISRNIVKEGQNYIINLTLSEANGNVSIKINFHFNIASTEECREILETGAVENCFNETLELLETVYGITIEQTN